MWVEGRKCVPGDVSSTSDAPAAQGAPEHTQSTDGQPCPVLQGAQTPFGVAKHLSGRQN